MRRPAPKRHSLRPALVAGLVVTALVAVMGALVLNGPAQPVQRPTTPGAAPAPKKTDDSYSDLLAAASKGDVASLELDARTNRADVTYKDARESDVTLPPDNGALLDRLASAGVQVRIKGEAGAETGSLLAALLPTLVLVALTVGLFVFMRRRAAVIS